VAGRATLPPAAFNGAMPAGDRAAVDAALLTPWSNGQLEGGVNKLKTLKRQMYGRAGFGLLRQRLLYVA